METNSILILIQLPLIGSIFIIGLQAITILNSKEFFFVTLAWAINGVYMLSLLFSTPMGLTSHKSLVLETFLDLGSSFFFFLAARKSISQSSLKKLKQIGLPVIGSILLLAGICKIIPGNSDYVPYIIVRYIPASIIDFTALFLLAQFFKKLTRNVFQAKFLYWGTLLYSFIQVLSIGQKESFAENSFIYLNIDTVGFSLGLFCKFLILIGLSSLLINFVKEIAIKDAIGKKLNEILGRTFHELSPPLSEIETITSQLIPTEEHRNHDIPVSKKARHEIKKVEEAILRIRTILTASNKMYQSELAPVSNIFKNFDFPIPIDEEVDVHNVNTLIEIAIMNLKTARYKNLEMEEMGVLNNMRFVTEYGANCNIFCNSVEIVQVFYNLFKNSYEASCKLNETSHLFVKSKILRVQEDNRTRKMVEIIVEDNGPGIDKDLQDKIFLQGFSTKNNKSKVKGYGLEVAKSYTEKNKGTIKVESPIINPYIREQLAGNGGARFIILFPKSNS